MGMTIAEKILARKSGQVRVGPGDLVTVEVDTVILFDNNFMPSIWREILKIKDRERVIVVLDHRVPAATQASAAAHRTARQFVEKFGIPRFHDVGYKQGISHQLVADHGYALPGTVLLCSDSHTCSAGVFNCIARGVGGPDVVYAAIKGETWFRIGATIRYALAGKLPTAEEAKAFIQSSDQNKRVALIGRLLDQSAHADYWAMKWRYILRVKAEFPVKVWPNAAQAYHRWVWESIAQNKPYDQFARELLTSSGSNFRVGSVNLYRAIQDKTPEGIAAAVGLALMGTRVVLWPEDRRVGMAVFFSQVGYKPTSEWKEEIVFWDPLNSIAVPGSIAPGVDAVAKSVTVTNQIPQALAEPLSENGPLSALFPDGTQTTIPPNRDPREVFADWLIRPENPWLTRAIVNRTWAWAMGRGIIHEPDDIREDNPPSNPELLAYLEKELVSSGYDLKHLKRLIFTSTAYQFSSIPRFKGPEAQANFAGYLLRRVEAEVLIDALNEITGSSDLYTSAVPEPFTYIPNSMSAVALADGSITSSFLTLFGRSARSTGTESERVNELASPQWLHMLNSATIQSKLQSGPKLAAMISAGGQPNEIAERLYLTILSRFPTDADVKAVEEHGKTGVTDATGAWVDLAWALINSPEFLLRH